MKKYIKIILIVFLIIILCACKNKEEYHLIELTSEELVINLSNEANSFIFAVLNDQKENYEKYVKDLESLAKNIKKDVYYIDSEHIDSMSSLALFTIEGSDFTDNVYYSFTNDHFEYMGHYEDFGTMYKNLKNIRYTGQIEYVNDETKQSYLDEAKRLYQTGFISKSYDYLNKAYTLDEAKEMYKNSKYYKLLNSWENYDFKNEELTEVNYTSLIFYHGVKYFNIASREGAFDDSFDRNFNFEDYTQLYYYVKDDIIYTSKNETGNYQETYKITKLDSNHLDLEETKKNGRTHNFTRRT